MGASSNSNGLKITDVTLRDGLQMLPALIPLEQKRILFEKIVACGFERVEITSFVSPRAMPQFSDAESLCQALFQSSQSISTPLMAFVPNEKGMERLLKFPIPWASAFVSTSETFNQKNVKMSIDQSLDQISKIVQSAKAAGRKTRVYVSTVWGCPYEKEAAFDNASAVLNRVFALGADEVAPSDTIGVATPTRVRSLLMPLVDAYGPDRFACHFHDTYGLALSNIETAYALGISRFDGAMGGVGGCPYAKGATGNVSSEDVLYASYRQGRTEKFNTEALKEVIRYLNQELHIATTSALGVVQTAGGHWYGI